jgi:hypothetical protein
MNLLSLLTRTPAEEVAPQDFKTLTPGTVIQNWKGEYGVVVDHDQDGTPFESNRVLRISKKQAKRLMRYIDGCR